LTPLSHCSPGSTKPSPHFFLQWMSQVLAIVPLTAPVVHIVATSDEDGEPVTTMIVEWQPNVPGGNRPGPDPWPKAGDKISVPPRCGSSG